MQDTCDGCLPFSYTNNIANANFDKWLVVMHEEMESLYKNQT